MIKSKSLKSFKSNSYLDERRSAPFIDICGAKHPAYSIKINPKVNPDVKKDAFSIAKYYIIT
jgi:hypothetical protein